MRLQLLLGGHGPGLSCGRNTPSYRCDVGNEASSSTGGDVVWLNVARRRGLGPGVMSNNQTQVQVKFTHLLYDNCIAKQPICKFYKKSTMTAKNEDTDCYLFLTEGPGHIHNTSTARLSPRDKDIRMKSYFTLNQQSTSRLTPAPNTAMSGVQQVNVESGRLLSQQ